MKKIINVDHKPDPSKEKIFFGDYGNFLRIDHVLHPVARRLKEYSEGNVWFVREIDYTNDTFENLTDVAKRIFKLNIAFQTLMDSGVTSGMNVTMQQILTSPVWSLVYNRIASEEAVHSESYPYALIEMFGSEEAEHILDLVYEDPFIKDRLNMEVGVFQCVDDLCIRGSKADDRAKESILRLLLVIYVLESLKFPFSFFITFTINKVFDSSIQGVSRLIKLIAHDELTFHVPVSRAILKILREEEDQGFTHLFKNGFFDAEARDLFGSAVDSELSWTTYLLADGELPGFNYSISKHFLRYHADLRLKHLGVEPLYGEPKSEIIDWFNSYKNINLQNTAQQEAENSAYQKGILQDDLANLKG